MKNSIFIMSSKEPRQEKLVHYCYHWIQKRKLGGIHQKQPKSASTSQANLYTKPSHNKLNVGQNLFPLQEVIKIFIHVLFVVDTCLDSLCTSSASRGRLITWAVTLVRQLSTKSLTKSITRNLAMLMWKTNSPNTVSQKEITCLSVIQSVFANFTRSVKVMV